MEKANGHAEARESESAVGSAEASVSVSECGVHERESASAKSVTSQSGVGVALAHWAGRLSVQADSHMRQHYELHRGHSD